MDPSISSADREGRLDAVLGEFLLAVDAGRGPDPAQIMAAHPDLSGDLHLFFESQKAFEECTVPLVDLMRSTSRALGVASLAGTMFGDYEILEKIGQGGMGTVYTARQPTLPRLVAIKIVRGDKDLSARELARFRNEAEIAARLDHPNIVPILEVGDHQGQLYFTMKLIPGGSLAERLARYRDQPRQAARLVAQAARAVHHAHQRGVLHRDLKPSNVLLQEAVADARTPVANAPGSPTSGEREFLASPERQRPEDAQTESTRPKNERLPRVLSPIITDFGLALRLEGDSDLTQTGTLLGTPSYMAPEQTTTERGKATTATDVYGLGTILYAALTGQPPFVGATPLDTMLLARNEEPVAPRSLNPRVDGDLEIICLKCLRKDPAHRYLSAEELAADLDHYLAGEPIAARPVTRRERFRRWMRRRPALASALGVAMLAGLGLAGGAAWHTVQLGNELDDLTRKLRQESLGREKETQERELLTRRFLYAANIRAAFVAWTNGETLQARQILAKWLPDQAAEDWRGFEWHFLWGQCRPRALASFQAHSAAIEGLAFSADGKLLATGAKDATAKIWDATTWKVKKTLPAFNQFVHSVRFHHDGQTLVGALQRSLILWDIVGSGPARKTDFAPEGWLPLGISSDGAWIARFNEGRIQVRDVKSNALRQSLPYPTAGVTRYIFSPDDKMLACQCYGAQGNWWDLASGKELGRMRSPLGSLPISFSPDGRILACFGTGHAASNQVTLCHLENLKTTILPGPAEAIAFSPDGKTLACAGTDHRVSLWDPANEKRVTLGAHDGAVLALAFSPDGRLLASADDKGIVKIWDPGLEPTHQSPQIIDTTGIAAYAPDGNTLAISCADRSIGLLDTRSGVFRNFLKGATGELRRLAFAPDGIAVAAADDTHTIRIWNSQTGNMLATLTGHSADITGLAFSADGNWLVSADRRCLVKVWDARTAKEHQSLSTNQKDIFAIALDPSSDLAALVALDGLIQIRKLPTGELARSFNATPTVHAVAFTHHGSKLAIATGEGVRLVDGVGRDLGLLPDNEAPPYSLSFSPDDRVLAGAGDRVFVAYWDVPSRSRIKGTNHGTSGAVTTVAFAPDGQTVVTASREGVVFFWDVRTWRARKLFPQTFRDVVGLGFTREGRLITGLHLPKVALRSYILGTAVDQAARGVGEDLICLWDPATGRRLATIGEPPDTDCHTYAFTPEGKAAAGTSDGSVWIWDLHTRQSQPPLFTSDKAEKAYNLRTSLLSAGIPAIGNGSEQVHYLAWADEGKKLVVLCSDRNLKVWGIPLRQETAHLHGPFQPRAIAQDGMNLIAQLGSGKVRIFDLASAGILDTFTVTPDRITALALAPAGQLLVAGTPSGAITIWDLKARKEKATVVGHIGEVIDLAFAPDGQTFASSGMDRTVRLWHVATGQELLTFEGPGPVHRVVFSPDGQTLAAAMGILDKISIGEVRWWTGKRGK